MKQLVQFASTGEVRLLDVPPPRPKKHQLLVRTLASAVSTGTERGNLDFARASLARKALKRPDLAAKVITKAMQEGPLEAVRVARGRLEEPFPLGYSSAGIVVELGPGVTGFRVGQFVACSGARFATHSEYVAIPQTMCAPVPQGVTPDDAAFAALGGVVIHAMRQGGVTVGSRVAVVGLGLLGLLAVQIAKAAGAKVLGAEVIPSRRELAQSLGADFVVDPSIEGAAEDLKEQCAPVEGADVVLVCATAKTNEPFVFGAEVARERATLVVVGNFPPDLPRRYGYDKELTVRFSRAWGPGTYDPSFFERGHPEGYPLSLVRWSAPQNMTTYLELVAKGLVAATPLITHKFEISEASKAYEVLDDPQEQPLGVLVCYGDAATAPVDTTSSRASEFTSTEGKPQTQLETKPQVARAAPIGPSTSRLSKSQTVKVGIVGAGNYVATTLLSALMDARDSLEVVRLMSPSGTKAIALAERYGIPTCSTDLGEVLEDADINAVIVATRHSSHARIALACLEAGKHVWVEKPLALSLSDVDAIERMAARMGLLVVVGCNRRFSPMLDRALRHVSPARNEPVCVVARINPGPLEPGHWAADPEEGGRLVGEGCHFFDLAVAAVPGAPTAVSASLVEAGGRAEAEGFCSLVEFDDGSLATISYHGTGPRSFSRERIEILGLGRAAAIEDWRRLYLSGRFTTHTKRSIRPQRGLGELVRFFVSGVTDPSRASSIAAEMLTAARMTLSARLAAQTGRRLALNADGSPAENLVEDNPAERAC